MKKKGQVLIRIMEFLTTVDMERVDLFLIKVEGLAKVHSKRLNRPWMYSVFVETLCTTGEAVVFVVYVTVRRVTEELTLHREIFQCRSASRRRRRTRSRQPGHTCRHLCCAPCCPVPSR
jgi:hypothetical protein